MNAIRLIISDYDGGKELIVEIFEMKLTQKGNIPAAMIKKIMSYKEIKEAVVRIMFTQW